MKIEKGKLNHIQGLFAKYKKTLKAPQGVVVQAFIEVVDDLFSYQISKEQVSYSSGSKILSVRISGPLKTEIKLKETEILMHLKGRLGTEGAPKKIM